MLDQRKNHRQGKKIINHFHTHVVDKKAGKSVFFLLVLYTLVLVSCENDLEKVSLVTGKQNLPVETSTDLTILYSDSARVKVKITTPMLERFNTEEPYTEMPKGVNVEFYDNELKVNSTLKAKYAMRRDLENVMEARNDVVVVNSKGEKLNTEHLIWDEKSSKIYSKEFVKITTPDKIIYGNGFEANQDFTNYKIFNIKGVITLEQNERTENP